MTKMSFVFLVSRMRLELTRPNGHYPLKVARLPIPPPRQMFVFGWSEKRDSNPRPRPWQGRALPTELFSRFCLFNSFQTLFFRIAMQSYNYFWNCANFSAKKLSFIFPDPTLFVGGFE